MNCIEKLWQWVTKDCPACMKHARLIEFDQLPEHEKFNFDSYDKDLDFIICCKKCKVYKLLDTDEKSRFYSL